MRPEASPRPIVVRPFSGEFSLELVHSLRERRVRDSTGLYIAEGVRFLAAATDAAAPLVGLVTCPRLMSGALPFTIVNRAKKSGCPVLTCTDEEFRELSLANDGQGVLMVLRQRFEELPQQVRRDDLWIGVESILSPGNLGTLLRAGEAAGATGLMVFGNAMERADPFDPATIRATMGSIFAHRYVATTHRDFRRWNRRYEVTVVGATAEAQTDYRSLSYRRPTVLMLGHERSGLSDAQRKTCDAFVRIPMRGRPDSLNVAMAGTLLLYEALNQRSPIRRR
jgi:TrmH family RNA methyltransferase